MTFGVAMFVAGLLGWTLLEYAIHGGMAHLHQTFISPIHAMHHRDPHAVFAIGTWLPSLVVLAVLVVLFGTAPGVIFYFGLLCGFAAYEVIHYRIHFASRLTSIEQRLRAHHLVHHLRRPQHCLGVTTGLWDRVFGTELSPREAPALYASVRDLPPLTGPSNLHLMISSFLSASRNAGS